MRVETSESHAKITGVQRGKSYVIQARSVGPTGLVSIWVDISHTVAGNRPPKDPLNLTGLSVIDGVKLSWDYPGTPPSQIDFVVERATAFAGPYIEALAIKATSVIVTETVDQEFYYKVRARNYEGQYSNYTNIISAKPQLADLPPKTLSIAAGVVEIDCFYSHFYLDLTANVTQVNFINVGSQDTILVEIKQKGAFNVTLPGSCVPVSGSAYVTSKTVNVVDLLGFVTVNSGAVWRYTAQKPAQDTGGGGSFVVDITPDPASATTTTDGVTASAPSVQVTATQTNGQGTITYLWERADLNGGTNFLIDNTSIANPTLSVASGTTQYGPVTQTWRVKATDIQPLEAIDTVDVTLTRNLLTVAISNQSVFGGAAAPNTASAGYVLNSNGIAYVDGGMTAIPGEWLGGGAASDYEVMFDQLVSTGPPDTNTGVFDVWQNLGTTRSVHISVGGGGHKIAQIDFRTRIRRVSDQVVLDTASITLNVESSL